jgi:universal stress protein E
MIVSDVSPQHEESLMVIIDPSQDTHIALDRAVITSKLRENKPKLHLFFGIDEENTDLKARNRKLYRDATWLNEIFKEVEDAGLEYTSELCWSTEWSEAVLGSSDRLNPDIILVPDSEPENRRSYFTNSKWALLRNSRCPVMIVRPGASGHRKKVLAAVNIQNDQAKYVELNEKIITRGLEVAKLYNAEFYVVNAYKDSMNYPDREKIMKMAGLPSKNVHAGEGEPAEVIAAFAQRIEADIVLIGTRSRRGAMAIMKGNTSEKVLNKLTQDIIAYS